MFSLVLAVILDKGLLNGLLLCYYFIQCLIFQVSLGLLVSPWALFQLFTERNL